VESYDSRGSSKELSHVVRVQGPIPRPVDLDRTQDQDGREAEMVAQACEGIGTPCSTLLSRLRSAKVAQVEFEIVRQKRCRREYSRNTSPEAAIFYGS
jgi:hypothetical protein